MKIITILLIYLSLFICNALPVNAEVIIDKNGNYVYEDKFVPTRGHKVKYSKVAQMMENGTKKIINKNQIKDTQQEMIYNKKAGEYEQYKRYSKNVKYTTINGYKIF